MGLVFSDEQLRVLRGLKDHISVINCVAGSGKTQTDDCARCTVCPEATGQRRGDRVSGGNDPAYGG